MVVNGVLASSTRLATTRALRCGVSLITLSTNREPRARCVRVQGAVGARAHARCLGECALGALGARGQASFRCH